jgi:hypothetical protein
VPAALTKQSPFTEHCLLHVRTVPKAPNILFLSFTALQGQQHYLQVIVVWRKQAQRGFKKEVLKISKEGLK